MIKQRWLLHYNSKGITLLQNPRKLKQTQSFVTSNYILVSIIIILKMDQLISKICCSQALLWRCESLISFSNLEMITYLQFIPRHVHSETILENIIILHNHILFQIIRETLLLHGILTKYKILCIIFLYMISSFLKCYNN